MLTYFFPIICGSHKLLSSDGFSRRRLLIGIVNNSVLSTYILVSLLLLYCNLKSTSTNLLSKLRCCQPSLFFFPAGKITSGCEDETAAVIQDSGFQVAFGENNSIQVVYFHFGVFLFFYYLVICCTLPAESYNMKAFPIHTVIESSRINDFCGNDNATKQQVLRALSHAPTRVRCVPSCPVRPLVPRTSPRTPYLPSCSRTSPRTTLLPLVPRTSLHAPVLFFVPPHLPLVRFEFLYFFSSYQLHFFLHWLNFQMTLVRPANSSTKM